MTASVLAKPPAQGSLTRYSIEHTRLRVTNAPVLPVPGATALGPVPGRPSTNLHPHRNWLPRAAFELPPERFSRYLDAPVPNLVDLVTTAARRVAADDIIIVRPIGSLAYARTTHDTLNTSWDVVRDLDIWVFLSSETIATAQWATLHQELLTHLHDVFTEHRVWSSRSDRTGYVYLRDQDANRRMVELKIADVAWLRQGLRRAHLRRANLLRTPRPAHFAEPRLEWAAHTPHENYFPTPAADGIFQDAITSIPRSEASYGQQHCFAENLAEAYRVLTPARLARATASQRHFYRYVRKVLKKQLLLAVMLGNERARSLAASELTMLSGPGSPGTDREFRDAFLRSSVATLTQLRRTVPNRLNHWMDYAFDDDVSLRPRFHPVQDSPPTGYENPPLDLRAPSPQDPVALSTGLE